MSFYSDFVLILCFWETTRSITVSYPINSKLRKNYLNIISSKIIVDKVFHFKKEYLHHFQGNNEVYHNLLSNNRIVKVTFMSAL